MDESKTLNDSEKYDVYAQLVSIRNVEIDQFWRRFIILIGIQGLILPIFISSFTDIIGTKHDFVILISIFLGFSLAIIITLIVRSNSFWKCFWEDKLKEFERENEFKFRIFADEHPPKDYMGQHKGYISATKLALVLSAIFVVFWGFFLLYYFINSNCIMVFAHS